MESKSKSEYIRFCNQYQSIPVFAQAWYLDIVTEGKWDVSISKDKQDNVIGAWPYFLERKYGVQLMRMPIYTPFLGPLFFSLDQNTTTYKTNSSYFKVLRALESSLPARGYTRIHFFPDHFSWYPLYDLGYTQSTRYTYIIKNRDIEDVKNNLKPQLRNVVTKKIHESAISKGSDISEFVSILNKTLETRNAGKFFIQEKVVEIIENALQKDIGTIYTYRNDIGDMLAGVFIIKDRLKHYCLFTASTAQGKATEAVACLIWRSLQECMQKGKDYDFEGSMIPGVEQFFRSFGGEQIPYHQVTKTSNNLLKLYHLFRS